MLEAQTTNLARVRAPWREGNSSAASNARIAITTNNSTTVKEFCDSGFSRSETGTKSGFIPLHPPAPDQHASQAQQHDRARFGQGLLNLQSIEHKPIADICPPASTDMANSVRHHR